MSEDRYSKLIIQIEFERKVAKLSKMWEEQRQEDITWMQEAYNEEV